MNLGDPLPYVRAAYFVALVLAAGPVFFRFLVAEPAFAAAGIEPSAGGRLRGLWSLLAWCGLAIAAVARAAWLVLLAAGLYGAPAIEVLRNGGVWTVLTQTQFGQVSLAQFAVAVLLALALVMIRIRKGAARGVVPLVLAAGFVIAPAWSGHAGAGLGLDGQFQLAADALHLLAAGAWVGGLLPLAMLLAATLRAEPPGSRLAIAAVHRFSSLGIACVAALVATGMVNSWFEVGSIGNLTATDYGRVLLVKLGLFAAMVVIAAVNRSYLTPRLAAAGAVRGLRCNSLVESALGIGVLLVVGVLGNMIPASHAQHIAAAEGAIPADASFVHLHAENGMAEVTIEPGRIGTAQATIRLWNENFDQVSDATRVTITLTAPAPGSAPIERTASQGSDGLWHVEGIPLGAPGNWMVEVRAEFDPVHRLDIAAPIVIGP